MEIPGIDTSIGRQNCCESQEIYCIVLKSVYDEGLEKLELFRAFYEEKNYQKYGVLAHGLKSVCRSVGAMKLGQLAENHENAVKNGDFAYVDANHEEWMQEYQELIENIGRTEEIMRS